MNRRNIQRRPMALIGVLSMLVLSAVVVGSHGYPTWERLLLGSVSQAIVAHAKCSVEVVRMPAPRQAAA